MAGPTGRKQAGGDWRRRMAAEERDQMFRPNVRLDPSRVTDYRTGMSELDFLRGEVREAVSRWWWRNFTQPRAQERHREGLQTLAQMGSRQRRVDSARRQGATLRLKEPRAAQLDR